MFKEIKQTQKRNEILSLKDMATLMSAVIISIPIWLIALELREMNKNKPWK
jgi:hypothetical protein